MGNHLVSSNIIWSTPLPILSPITFTVTHLILGPLILLSSEHDKLFLLSGSLHCLFCSPGKVLSWDLLMVFGCLLKYHPKDTFPDHSTKKRPPPHSIISLICLISFKAHITAGNYAFCLFYWNVNSKCGDLAFLFPVGISVLTGVSTA